MLALISRPLARPPTVDQFAIPDSGAKTSFGEVFLSLLSFEVDIWGRRKQQTKAARAQLRAPEEDRKAVATVVVSDVATNYFNLLELDLELEIAKDTLSAREESLRIIKARQQGASLPCWKFVKQKSWCIRHLKPSPTQSV